MPAFFTHYSLGVKNFKKLEQKKLKHIIKEHRKAYALGTLGPDIFFYYFPDIIMKDKKPASVMHEKHAQLFFENMLKRAELFSSRNKMIAYAYIAGFIGHYELDVHCHPYVYSVTESDEPYQQSGEHFALEAAMDLYCSYEYLHRIPTELDQRKIIAITKQEKRVISTLLADAYNVTYHLPKQSRLSIRIKLQFVRTVIFLLEDRKGWKEKIWTGFEKIIFGYPVTAPLFINNNSYEYTVEDWYQFHELWREALTEYGKLMPYLERYIIQKGDKRTVRRELLNQIGNHSYHTGKIMNS